MTTISQLRTPIGTYGLAVAPVYTGEVYAVAANWAQASDNVQEWSGTEWIPTRYQVADFRHSPREALAAILPDDFADDVAAIVAYAAEIRHA